MEKVLTPIFLKYNSRFQCSQIFWYVHCVASCFNDELKCNERSLCGGRQGASREKLSKANSKHIIRRIQCTVVVNKVWH